MRLEPSTNQENSPFDYSAKKRSDELLPVCPQVDSVLSASQELAAIFSRQVVNDDDYSCGPDKPCRNGKFSSGNLSFGRVQFTGMNLHDSLRRLLSQGHGILQLR